MTSMPTFYRPTEPTGREECSKAQAAEWLLKLYGPVSLVGFEDGTEDDWGDAMFADLPFAVLGHAPDVPQYDTQLIQLDERVGGEASTWEEALDIALDVLRPGWRKEEA